MDNNKKKDKKKVDLYFIILLIATSFYLLLECAFNATLLDVAGTDIDTSNIHAIEFWGRMISGIAVSLAFCGTVVFPFLHKRNAALLHYITYGTIVFIYLISLTYYGQKLLIDSLVQTSTPEERRIATLVSIASNQLRRGELLIEGFDLSKEARKTPSTKAFVASFASIVSFLPNAEEIILRELDDILMMNTIKRIGAVEEVYHGAYRDSLEVLALSYKEYISGIEQYHHAIKDVDNQTEIAWNNYVMMLRKNNINPNNISSRFGTHDKIREALRNEGFYVSDNWHPEDKKGFFEAYKKQYLRKVNEEAKRRARLSTPDGSDFPLTLTTFDKFLAHSTVQRSWKEELSFPLDVELKRNMSLATFCSKIYNPLITHIVKEQKAMLLSKADSFEKDAEFEEIGKQAYEASIVAPIAIAFSIVGVIVHLCKACFYSLKIILPKKMSFLAVFLNIALFAGLLYLPMRYPTPITSSEVYKIMDKKLATVTATGATSFKWILQAQTFIYPINEMIREKVFLGMSFGMNIESEEESKETTSTISNG